MVSLERRQFVSPNPLIMTRLYLSHYIKSSTDVVTEGEDNQAAKKGISVRSRTGQGLGLRPVASGCSVFRAWSLGLRAEVLGGYDTLGVPFLGVSKLIRFLWYRLGGKNICLFIVLRRFWRS